MFFKKLIYINNPDITEIFCTITKNMYKLPCNIFLKKRTVTNNKATIMKYIYKLIFCTRKELYPLLIVYGIITTEYKCKKATNKKTTIWLFIKS